MGYGVLDILGGLLLLIGAVLMLIASVGLIRMPDLYLRMSAASKASSLGVGAIVVAAAVLLADAGVTGRSLALLIFVLLTSPIGAHVIGRAAYRTGVPTSENTIGQLVSRPGGKLDRR